MIIKHSSFSDFSLLQNNPFTCAHFGLYMRLKRAGNGLAGKGFTCAYKSACIAIRIHACFLQESACKYISYTCAFVIKAHVYMYLLHALMSFYNKSACISYFFFICHNSFSCFLAVKLLPAQYNIPNQPE